MQSGQSIKEIKVLFEDSSPLGNAFQDAPLGDECQSQSQSQDVLFQSQNRLFMENTTTKKHVTSNERTSTSKRDHREAIERGIQTVTGDVEVVRSGPSSISLHCKNFTGSINLQSVVNATHGNGNALLSTTTKKHEQNDENVDEVGVRAMEESQQVQPEIAFPFDDTTSRASTRTSGNRTSTTKEQSYASPGNQAFDPTDVSPAVKSADKKAVRFADPLHHVMDRSTSVWAGHKHPLDSECSGNSTTKKSNRKSKLKKPKNASSMPSTNPPKTEDVKPPVQSTLENKVFSLVDEDTCGNKYEMPCVHISPQDIEGKAPSRRWGHRSISIDNTKMLVYGGETSEDDLSNQEGLTVAKGDTHIFNLQNLAWEHDAGTDGEQRAWHGLVSLRDRAFVFGGERQTALGTEQCTSSMFFDTALSLWYSGEDAGTQPTSRAGHSMCVIRTAGDNKAEYTRELSKIRSGAELQKWISDKIWEECNNFSASSQKIVVFGGIVRRKWTNELFSLDVDTMKWRIVRPKGTAPSPRCYHSAVGMGSTMVVFGGNDSEQSFNDVYVLDTSSEPWVWVRPCVVGEAPKPRTGHVAAKVSPRHILITGGWDPNAEGDDLTFFDDSFLLDCEEWEWVKVNGKQTFLSETSSAVSVSSTGRTGHSGVALNLARNTAGNKSSDFINPCCLLFGGVNSEESRQNDLSMLVMPSIVRNAWDAYFQEVNPSYRTQPIPMADLSNV